jgi:CheY-like chemotaxis protein
VIVAPLSGAFVLVVEDNDDSRTLMATLLALYGAQVTAVASVREALEAFGRIRPDVVVSDINMPLEDGFDLIRRLRTLAPEEGGTVPALAITAYAEAGDRTAVLAAGFQAFLPKPVEGDLLVKTLEGLIRQPA